MRHTTRNSKIINASAENLYNALITPRALETWQVPGDMTGKVYEFDLREGGSYTMSLFYPETENINGKTAGKEDRFTARFIELTPFTKIVEVIQFDTADPGFSGEMIMEVTFEDSGNGTNVTFLFKNIPPGIRPEDNEAGTISSLEKLAKYVE